MQYNTYILEFKDFRDNQYFEKKLRSYTLRKMGITLFEYIEQYEIKYHCICLDYQLILGTKKYKHKLKDIQ